MHSFKEQPLPSFGAFEKIASYCARSLIDHVRDGNQCFEALIFGFDPNLAEPRVIKTKLGPGESGAQVTVEFILPRVDKIITLGTGARHLPDEMPKPSEVPLQIFVSNVINSQADRNTGGHVQILELNSKKCVFRGTMLDGPSWDDANYSGVDRGALGEVEGYSVGSSEPVQLKPYSAIRSAAMEKELKHRLTNKELPKSNKNVGPIMTFLSVIHKDQAIGVVDENYHVSPSPLISGQYYFSKVCPSCWRNSPSIHSPANGEGFNGKIEGKGQITTSCQFCRKEMRYEPKDFKVETRWK